MATTYVESSALVKRYVAEVGSAWVRRTVARPVHQVLYKPRQNSLYEIGEISGPYGIGVSHYR